MLIDWRLVLSFSLVFDIQWIYRQYLIDWTLSSSWIQSISVSNKNLTLHWLQNSCLGITIFLVFSYCAIWRVITCSPLTLRRCFIKTPQHLLSLFSETADCHSFLFTFNSPALHKYVSTSSPSKSSKFLIPLFLVKCSKLHSVFKILSKSWVH